MTTRAEVIADSISSQGPPRLTTMQLRYPRFIHAEFMTHRVFCLAGDAQLEFELPGRKKQSRRLYVLSLRDFVCKWLYGSSPHKSRWGTERIYDLRTRLKKMQIRQIDEATGEIITSSVVDVCESGLKPVYEVTAGPYKVAGSLDHRVLTDGGWRRIKELQVGDLLVVRTRKKPEYLKSSSRRLTKFGRRWRSAWQKKQRAKLQDVDPMCRKCREVEGVDIHHIVPVHKDPSRVFDPTNITLLCESCHLEEHRKQGWQEGAYIYSNVQAVDSIKYRGVENTYDLEIAGPFPNFLANGVVVHNSRNASSSRAIPVERLIRDVIDDPVYPSFWGKNQPGMQADKECDDGVWLTPHEGEGKEFFSREAAWSVARDYAIEAAQAFADAGYHKQIVNRLLEPFCHINVVVTATEWANFFALRCHPDAQPEMRMLAEAMRAAMGASQPRLLRPGEWHLPYFDPEKDDVGNWLGSRMKPIELAQETCIKISVARCARVSYLTQDGRRPSIEEDLALYERLVASVPLHASPAEHQATPDVNIGNEVGGDIWARPKLHGNFRGWVQYRRTLPGGIV